MRKVFIIIPILILGFGALSCSTNYFGSSLTRSSSLEPVNVTETPIDTPQGADPALDYFNVTSTWNQPATPGFVRPEIVFILDSSVSMGDERTAVVDSLSGWLTTLQSQGIENFCVDVMEAAHGSQAGKLRAASGNAKCLCTDDGLTIDDIVTEFRENMDIFSFKGEAEAGLYSLHTSLTNDDITDYNRDQGCFRDTHTLVPLFVADENDMCATADVPNEDNCADGEDATLSDDTTVDWATVAFDNTPFPELADGFELVNTHAVDYVEFSCNEAEKRLELCSEATPTGPGGTYSLTITPTSVVAEVRDYNGFLPTFGTSIVYNTTTFPLGNGNSSKGWGYLEAADEFGQDPVNLALTTDQSDFNEAMNAMANALVDQLSFINAFQLPEDVCTGEESSVVVKVNGVTVDDSNWTLSPAGDVVIFDPSFDFDPSDEIIISFTRCE